MQKQPEGRQPRFQPGQQVRSHMGIIWTVDEEGGRWNSFWHDFDYRCIRYTSTGVPLGKPQAIRASVCRGVSPNCGLPLSKSD